MSKTTRSRWDEICSSGRSPSVRLAILATFTADYVTPYLGVALEDAGLPANVFVGPYNQIVQECRFEGSSTSAYRADILVVWPRFEELWGALPLPLVDDLSTYVEGVASLADAAVSSAERSGATLVFVLPAIPEMRPLGLGDANNARGVVAAATNGREELRRRLAGRAGVLLFDSELVIRNLGASNAYNTRLAALAHMPFSDAALRLLGSELAGLIRSDRKTKKVVVVDGDNTLWGGVVGEDGPDRVNLRPQGSGEGFLEFQRYLRELRRAGVLLALASKNDERDVWGVFERREMRLKQSDLAAWRIGWQPKSESIKQIAEELGLGLDSFVFIDDNPAEIAEVSASAPGVSCIRFPADPVDWMAAVQGAGIFDRAPPTQEDLGRAGFYAQEQLRKSSLAAAANPEEYLAQLQIAVSVIPVSPSDIPRLAQLIAKTNQFNLNGKRRSDAELVALLRQGRHVARIVSAADKYGDYGVIGAFIVENRGTESVLDTFVLSCRALGRGVEETMIAAAFEASGGAPVFATVVELPRNEPARRFFSKIGCETAAAPHALARVEWPTYVKRVSA